MGKFIEAVKINVRTNFIEGLKKYIYYDLRDIVRSLESIL